jgi:hypothetical protein
MALAVLDSGTYYHHETIYGERYRGLFDRVIYVPEMTPDQLAGVTVLIVADRTHADLLRRHAAMLMDFLRSGRTLIVLGENEAQTWAPAVRWSPRPTNFWWWLDKDAKPPHQLASPHHELFSHVPFEDTIWHFHGVLTVPAGAEALIVVPPDAEGRDQGGALLYDDRVTTPGRLIVSTLDPFYHHGSNFMPATTRFLDGFLPWARNIAHGSKERTGLSRHPLEPAPGTIV